MPTRRSRRSAKRSSPKPSVTTRAPKPKPNTEREKLLADLRVALAAASSTYKPEPHVIEEQIADAIAPWFVALQKHPNTQHRGIEFEKLLQRLFRMNGFDAERNPSIAHPRQTDLLARLSDKLFLLEAKWQQGSINIDDLDSIHARMRRAPRGTIGCFFSMSTFTDSAIERANRLRDSELGGYEILLFDGSEVTGLLNGWSLLRESLETKLECLREKGETVFLRDSIARQLQPLDIPFPAPSVRRSTDHEEHPLVGNADNFAFGELPSEFDTWRERMQGFELYGSPHVKTFEELIGLLQLFHSRLRLSGQGGYTITELRNEKVWFGTSAHQLIVNLANIAERYATAQITHSHHSEEFCFYDITRFGALLVSGRQRVGKLRLHDVSFELRIPGIPLDPEPLRSLTKRLGYKYELLTPIDGDLITRVELPRGDNELLVEPLEYLRDITHPEFVSAAVVKNPFWNSDRKGLPDLPEPLRSVSFLVGKVRDFLSDDERVRRFRVRHMQVLHFRRGYVVDTTFEHDTKLRYIEPSSVADKSSETAARSRQCHR